MNYSHGVGSAPERGEEDPLSGSTGFIPEPEVKYSKPCCCTLPGWTPFSSISSSLAISQAYLFPIAQAPSGNAHSLAGSASSVLSPRLIPATSSRAQNDSSLQSDQHQQFTGLSSHPFCGQTINSCRHVVPCHVTPRRILLVAPMAGPARRAPRALSVVLTPHPTPPPAAVAPGAVRGAEAPSLRATRRDAPAADILGSKGCSWGSVRPLQENHFWSSFLPISLSKPISQEAAWYGFTPVGEWE